jgi:putative salt-induced outer membrane protein YdiY
VIAILSKRPAGSGRIWLFLPVLLVVCAGAPAFAQAPAPAAPTEPPPRLEASGQFSFLDTRGNADTQALGTGGEMTFRPAPMTYRAKVAFAQTETDGDVSARSLAGLFRAAREIHPRLSVYGQYDFLRDVFAGVDQRHIIEGGASYLAVDRAPHRLRLDGGLGYLYEDRPDGHFDSMTLSLAAAYRLALSATSELTYEPRFLLPLADTSAWKFEQNLALAVAINSILSLKVAHTVRYSAAPPEGFDSTDTIMAISLVAKIRRAQ